jgi:hypothetical protein
MTTISDSKTESKAYVPSLPRNSPPHGFDGLFDTHAFMFPGPTAAPTMKPVSGKRDLPVTSAPTIEHGCLQTRPPFDPQHGAEDAALIERQLVRGQGTPVILEHVAERCPAESRIKDGHRCMPCGILAPSTWKPLFCNQTRLSVRHSFSEVAQSLPDNFSKTAPGLPLAFRFGRLSGYDARPGAEKPGGEASGL